MAQIGTITATTGWTRLGQTVTITIPFIDENVTLTGGNPILLVSFDQGGLINPVFTGGNGTNALEFSFVVASNQFDPTGIEVTGFFTNGAAVTGSVNGAGVPITGFTSTVVAAATVDGIVPSSGSSSATTRTNAATTNFGVGFSEAVTGVDATDFTLTTTGVTGASITNVSGSGQSYTVTVDTGTGDGTIKVNFVSDGTVKDAAQNATTTGFSTPTTTIDKTAPTVTIVPAVTGPTNGATVGYTVTFSETVTGVDINDFVATTVSGAPGVSLSNFAGTGADYTFDATTTGTSNGSFRVDSKAFAFTAIKDATNNQHAAYTGGATVAVDRVAPAVSTFTSATATPNSGSTASWTLVFDNKVTGVNDADFTLTKGGTVNGAITNVASADGGTTWTVDVTGVTGDGALGIELNAGDNGIADLATNAYVGAAKVTSGSSVTFDHTAPTVSTFTSATATPNKGSTASWTLVFDNKVSGVDASDFTVTKTNTVNGGVTNVSTSDGGTTWTVDVTGVTGDGVLGLELNAGGNGIADLAANAYVGAAKVTSGNTVTFDHTVPVLNTLTVPSSSTTNATSATWTATFSEAVTGLDATDFSLTKFGTATGTIGTPTTADGGTTWTIAVTGVTGDGGLNLDFVSDGTVKDSADNATTAGKSGQNKAFDHTAPTVQSITAAGALTNAATSNWTVTYSEPVTGVDSADFSLTVGGTIAGASIGVPAVGAGNTWTVAVNHGTSSGTIRLNATSNGTVVDAAGNATSGSFLTGDTVTVDKAAPAVTSVTAAAGSYATGQPLNLVVKFDETVTVDTAGGTPTVGLTLDTGGAVQAAYVGGSGGTDLTFRYVVGAGTLDTNGPAVAANLSLNGGTIRDAATNDAAAALNGVAAMTGVLINPPPPPPSTPPTPAAQPTTPMELINPVLTTGLTKALGFTPSLAAAPTIQLADGSTIENPLLTQQKAVQALMTQVAAGTLTQAQAVEIIVDMADATTSVATLSYAFFTGKTPTADGLTYLTASSGNPNDLNDAYYAKFNIENRYINFAVNLGKLGEGAAKFTADYGALSLDAALAKAYTAIFGFAPAPGKIAEILNGQVTFNGQTQSRANYFAFYGQDGANGLGTKAAAVGFLMAEAVKADLGPYAVANEAFLRDSFDGTAAYNVDLSIYLPPGYSPTPIATL